jgi:hypothetical protein
MNQRIGVSSGLLFLLLLFIRLRWSGFFIEFREFPFFRAERYEQPRYRFDGDFGSSRPERENV